MRENQDTLEPPLREAVEAYHRPPPTPRRELWLQLQYARAIRQGRTPRRRTFHPLIWAVGIAASLAIGVGLGRLSVRQPGPGPAPAPVAAATAAAEASPASASPYRIAAAEYLGQAEVFLTLFRMSVRGGSIDPLTPATARPLLATNRLLLDSPVSADPKVRLLLEDLELVLAQIAQLSPRPEKGDLKLITTGIEQSRIMTRLWQKPIGSAGMSGT